MKIKYKNKDELKGIERGVISGAILTFIFFGIPSMTLTILVDIIKYVGWTNTLKHTGLILLWAYLYLKLVIKYYERITEKIVNYSEILWKNYEKNTKGGSLLK